MIDHFIDVLMQHINTISNAEFPYGVLTSLQTRTLDYGILCNFDIEFYVNELSTENIEAVCDTLRTNLDKFSYHDSIMGFYLSYDDQILSKQKEQFAGKIQFIFQLDEETAGGSKGMIKEGVLSKNKVDITIWTHRQTEVEELEKNRVSKKLSNYKIPENIKITSDIKEAVNDKDLLIIAVPAFAFEETVKLMVTYVSKKTFILIATKGIQQNTCMFLNDVFKKYCNNKYGVISGPTFANDIIKESPIGFSLATSSGKVEKVVRECFENKTTKFRRR